MECIDPVAAGSGAGAGAGAGAGVRSLTPKSANNNNQHNHKHNKTDVLSGHIQIQSISNPFDTDSSSPPIQSSTDIPVNDDINHINDADIVSAEQVIAAVQQQMLTYQSECDYVNAQRCKEQLQVLTDQLKYIKQQHLQHIQQSDINTYYSLCMQHRQQFTDQWSRKLLEHKHRADILIERLKERHIAEATLIVNTVKQGKHIPHSNQLITLRKQQLIHANNHDYIQAANVKLKADKLECSEHHQHHTSINQTIQLKLEQLQLKHNHEKQQLSSKLQLEYKTLAELKSNEWTKLMKKLKYTESELKKSHLRQCMLLDSKLDSKTVLGNSTNTRKTSTLSKSGQQMLIGNTSKRKQVKP